ncbi:TPA: LPXTG cell wall anchor domain-containing protein [Streptococcus suis]
MTGETYSVLGIVGVIFAGIGLVRVVRKRRG